MHKSCIYGLLMLFSLTILGCTTQNEYIDITLGNQYTLNIGDELILEVESSENIANEYIWTSSDSCVIVTQSGKIIAMDDGSAIITVYSGEYFDKITIIVLPEIIEHVHSFVEGKCECGEIDDNYDDNIDFTTDPYLNVTKEEFYENYQEATCYLDAYYRSLHGLMSGSIEEQDQEPTISAYQPNDGMFLFRNTACLYTEDGNAYKVLDVNGKVVKEIYYGGAYVTLEDVAAYLFAFGDIPANYSSSKKTKPTSSIWGEYLRLNHTKFSGDTSRYPYEPALPDISGNGGSLEYYEVDIGTTGTDCDPRYDAVIYNDGFSIERGAARIVYTRYDQNGDTIIDPNEKYLFYTYNHYNDFQEYLNYYGGWGKIFGNITGGGTISSKYDYAPTDYIKTIRVDFTKEQLNSLSSNYSFEWMITNYCLLQEYKNYFIY